MASPRIPVTVLTGFLGSGKTTLLNRILTESHGRRIAVIENEFGEVGIDHELVVRTDEEIFEMNNGCICCTVRGDLIRILGRLQQRRNKFDAVLIETTGLADPAPVAQTFFMDDEVREAFELDAIVTLVDARHVTQHLDESSECQEQIAFADVLLLNKCDLVEPAELDALEARLRSMNATTRMHRTTDARIGLDQILGLRAFDLDAKLELDADFLIPESPFEWAGRFDLSTGRHFLHFSPGPDSAMRLLVLPYTQQDGEAFPARAGRVAEQLFSGEAVPVPHGGSIPPGTTLHSLALGDAGGEFALPVERAGSHALFTEHGPDAFAMQFRGPDGSVLVAAEAREYAAAHQHDDAVTSVGIVEDAPLDVKRTDAWLSQLLRDKGADLFRTKGVLNFKDAPNRFIFQGVHMLIDGKPDRPWREGEERRTHLVFIGRNLDREALEAGFRACLA